MIYLFIYLFFNLECLALSLKLRKQVNPDQVAKVNAEHECYLFGMIARVRVVFRKTVVGD